MRESAVEPGPGKAPALTELQSFWRQVGWISPVAAVLALAIGRPHIPGVSPRILLIVCSLLVALPPVINLLSVDEGPVDEVHLPTTRQVATLAGHASVALALAAIFLLSDPSSDAFVLLLLPQLLMATTRRWWLMLATMVAVGAAFVGIVVVAARIHRLAVPWSAVGVRLSLLVAGTLILGRISMILASHIRTLRELHSVVAHQALHDALTGLPNRALFFERVRQALARQQRMGTRFAVVFVDLDDLKVVNDTLGHTIGDELLRRTAERLRAELRATDTPARLGGDEFAALLDDPGSEENLSDLAQRLLERLSQPLATPSHLGVSVSIGVATSEQIVSAEELIRRADFAMYRAKAEGKGRVVHFDIHHPVDVRGFGD